MSRLECLGRSSKVSQKQLTSSLISPRAETNTPYDTAGQKPITNKRRSVPLRAPLHSVQGSVSVTVEEQCAGETAATEETLNITAGVEETAAPIQDLKMKSPQKPQRPSDLTLTGEKVHAPPPIEPLPVPEPCEEEEEQSGEEDDEDEYEGHRAPLELMAEFLQAVMLRDFQLASKLCQMILIYEPENPEAKQFLPLIQEKLLEEQEEEQSKGEGEGGDDDDNDDDDDDDDDNENDSDSRDEVDSEESSSDDESTRSSGSSSSALYSSSSSSSSEDDEERVNQGIRHKLCPPSHLSML